MAKYVYCVTDCEGQRLRVPGIDDARVDLLRDRDISAAVSDVAFEEIDPTDENLLAHERVNQHIMLDKRRSVVPLAFCTITKTEDDVTRILRNGHSALRKNLDYLRDRVELGVKVFCDVGLLKKSYKKGMYKASEEIARDIYERVREVSVDAKLNELMIDNMIMNAAVLVERDGLEELRKAVVEMDGRYPDMLLVRISGPLAAYSFVEMPS